MYQVTWITRGGELMACQVPQYRVAFRLYAALLGAGNLCRLWDRTSKHPRIIL